MCVVWRQLVYIVAAQLLQDGIAGTEPVGWVLQEKVFILESGMGLIETKAGADRDLGFPRRHKCFSLG